MKDRILLIGKRKSVLIKLAGALSKEGFESDWINDVSKAASHYDGKKYSVVAFGRGVKRFDKEYLKQKYQEQNPRMIFVEGLAPIPELFVEQVKLSFMIHSPNDGHFILYSVKNIAQGLLMNFTLKRSLSLDIDLYHLNFLYRSKKETIPLGKIQPGDHSITIPASIIGKKKPGFAVVKNDRMVLGIEKLYLER